MTINARLRYPTAASFKILGELGNKLTKLTDQEKDRLESMLSSLRVNWSIESFESFPRHNRLRSAYVNLHELYIVMRHLADEMTSEPSEQKDVNT